MSLLNTIIDTKPPELLYHYTSPAGLFGIITNTSIWATNIHYLNDSAEFYYAFNLLNNKLDPREFEENFILLVKEFAFQIKETNRFVFSLSESEDLLSQWRGYCPSTGGYSLGFDSNKLLNIIGKNHEFHLYPCQYEIEVQKRLIKEFLETAYSDYKEVKTKETDQAEIKKILWQKIPTKLGIIAAIIKEPCWSEEKEWRIISLDSIPITDPRFNLRPGKHNLVPYLEIPLGYTAEEWPFKKLKVGPNPQQQMASKSASMLFSVKKIKGFEISKSPTPYREC